MAGKSKLVEEALRIAREGLEGIAKGKSQTPEQLLKGFSNQKPRVPYEEWRYEFEPTAELLPSKEFNPESLKPGDVIIPLVGDRTSTGRKITSIAGTPLETPAITEGGPDYMRGPSQQADKSVWASGKSVIPQLEGRIQNALRASEAKGYKDPNVYGSYVAMGPQSGDFSTHTAEAVMGMLPSAKIKRADVKEFDTVMRDRFPDWPGLMSPKASDYVVNANAGEHRKAFIDAIDSAYWRDRGAPDVSLARYATTTPELVSAPTEAAGYNIARITPGEKPNVITKTHRSYPLTMHGEYVGGLPPGMTRDELFTQFSRNFDADAPARNYVMAKRRSFGMDPNAFQVMEGQDIEDLIRKVTALKSEYADGGEVDDDIDDAMRIARAEGGRAGYATDGAVQPPVMMEDAKGNKYDAQGNIVPPSTPGPNPQRVDMQSTYNAILSSTPPEKEQSNYEVWQSLKPEERADFSQKYPDYSAKMRQQDIAASEKQVREMPEPYRSMTHPLQRFQTSKGTAKINAPLLGGTYEYSAPDVSDYVTGQTTNPSQEYVQAIYDNKTLPFYFTPAAPFAATADVAEGVINQDPMQAAMAALGYNSVSNLLGKGVSAAGRAVYDAVKSHPYITGGVLGAGSLGVGSDEAEAGPARWFSKALEVARAIPMEKMTGEQALAMLRKGTSPEELRWMGAEPFLSGQKSVSKDDLVSFLEKNRVQPKEITLGGSGKPTRREDVKPDSDIVAKYVGKRDQAYKEYNEINQQIKQAADAEQWGRVENLKLLASDKYREYNGLTEKMIDEQIARMGGLGKKTKYGPDSGYEGLYTPGGEGYRETLYQYGGGERPQVKEINGMWSIVGPDGEVMRSSTGGSYTYWSEADANRAAKSLYRGSGEYTSGHWDDPNVLFHTRSQTLDVTPPGANRPYKAHNVDETQSDLGQAGRKSGFRDQNYEPRIKQINADLFAAEGQYKVRQAMLDDNYRQQMKKISDLSAADERAFAEAVRRGEMKPREFEDALSGLVEKYRPMTKPILEKYTRDVERLQGTLGNQINNLKQERANLNIEQSKMPAMPFVGSTEGWTDRSIKHELDKALDSEADYFTWSPGDVHAERYGLEKHLSKVEYNPDDGSLMAYDPKGKMVVNESIGDPSELDEYVGKELADKLRAEERSRSDSIDDAYEVHKDEETGEWTISLYGDQSYDSNGDPLVFGSKGEAKDYLNQMKADDYASNPVSLSGLDLKVGGEGMRGYYDKVYLKRVQEVLRKATGEKPNIEVIEVQTANGPRKQLGVRLTDEMREKARFSDFNKGGRVTGGNTYDNDQAIAHALALTSEY